MLITFCAPQHTFEGVLVHFHALFCLATHVWSVFLSRRMPKPVIIFRFCGMDCFGTYLTHAQTCDNVCVQCATDWTASVHILHMSQPVRTFLFRLLWKMCPLGVPKMLQWALDLFRSFPFTGTSGWIHFYRLLLQKWLNQTQWTSRSRNVQYLLAWWRRVRKGLS